MSQAAPSGPIYSEDGHWWWDGQQWRPTQEPTPVTPGSSSVAPAAARRASLPLLGAGLAVLIGLGILASVVFGFNPLTRSGTDGAPTGPDVLTAAQASAAASSFWAAYTAALGKGDQKTLQTMFTGPALSGIKARGILVIGALASNIKVAVPHQAHYPVWFMAEIVGQPNAGQMFDLILTKQGASSPWQSPVLYVNLSLPSLRSDGFAESPLSSAEEANLAARPDDVPADYARALQDLQSGRAATGIFSGQDQGFFLAPAGFEVRTQFKPDPAGVLLRSRTSSGGELIVFVLDGTLTLDRPDGGCMNPRTFSASNPMSDFFTGASAGRSYRNSARPFDLYVELEVPPSGSSVSKLQFAPFYLGNTLTAC